MIVQRRILFFQLPRPMWWDPFERQQKALSEYRCQKRAYKRQNTDVRRGLLDDWHTGWQGKTQQKCWRLIHFCFLTSSYQNHHWLKKATIAYSSCTHKHHHLHIPLSTCFLFNTVNNQGLSELYHTPSLPCFSVTQDVRVASWYKGESSE